MRGCRCRSEIRNSTGPYQQHGAFQPAYTSHPMPQNAIITNNALYHPARDGPAAFKSNVNDFQVGGAGENRQTMRARPRSFGVSVPKFTSYLAAVSRSSHSAAHGYAGAPFPPCLSTFKYCAGGAAGVGPGLHSSRQVVQLEHVAPCEPMGLGTTSTNHTETPCHDACCAAMLELARKRHLSNLGRLPPLAATTSVQLCHSHPCRATTGQLGATRARRKPASTLPGWPSVTQRRFSTRMALSRQIHT